VGSGAGGRLTRSQGRRVPGIYSAERVLAGSDADAVWSSRVALAGRAIRRRPTRHYLGRVVGTYLFRGLDGMPYDSQSGLKLFGAGPALDRVLCRPFRTRWLFEVEMMARWRADHGSPMRVWEVPVESWHDVAGTRIRGLELVRLAREVTLARGLLKRSLRGAGEADTGGEERG
jgi:dolichyl-phosphate beta-glucosyltransferase